MPGTEYIIRSVLGEYYSRLFWAKVNKTDTCWLWTGAKKKNYPHGKFSVGVAGKTLHFAPHRLVYEMFVGRIPEGMEPDHLCRVPDCCNYEHVEPVTHKENMLRGENPAAWHARQTHCKYGHSLEDAYRQHGARVCRTCRKQNTKGAYQARKGRRPRRKDLEFVAYLATLKTHCIHGHSLADAYINPAGNRHCRPCKEIRQREYRERQKRLG